MEVYGLTISWGDPRRIFSSAFLRPFPQGLVLTLLPPNERWGGR